MFLHQHGSTEPIHADCRVLITVDFVVSAGRNWGDSVVCFEVSPSQAVDSEHFMPCYQMLVNHVAAAVAVSGIIPPGLPPPMLNTAR
ncbi:hypothetical protein GYH30_001959 [Glycine max]|nr:hypothetical protein GYH30_001959 [Glycine max]